MGYFEGNGNVRWEEVAGDKPDEVKLELVFQLMPLSDAASIGSGGVKRGSQGLIRVVTQSYRECFPISIALK
jgi:hypothetical protein